MQKINYQKELENRINQNQREDLTPSLLLHSCCAPCSSYTIEYLSQYFHITVLYYNPNISPQAEYEKRKREQLRLLAELPTVYPVQVLDCDYDAAAFMQLAKGLEHCPEGGERCFHCYALRLRKTAELAKANGFAYFCTTLTISPLKNAQKINEIGLQLQEELGVAWLPSDFKKREGYKRSIELSRQYHLYRQNFCGCVYSKRRLQDEEGEDAKTTCGQNPTDNA